MPHYTSTPANNGDKTVILEGWIPRIVVIGPGHEQLAQECLELLNEKRANSIAIPIVGMGRCRGE